MDNNELEKIGEKFGNDIVELVMTNRAFTVTVEKVDDTSAYVTIGGSTEQLPVPLTGINIQQSAFIIKPNVGSLAIIQFADSAENSPFFISYSEIDFFSFKRGATEFSWEMTPTERDVDGDEVEGETNDVVKLDVGASTVKVDKDVWEFNGGKLGGLAIAPELKTQLDKITVRIDGIINAIENGVPIPQDGGVGYQASMKVILDTLTEVEDFSKIENEKITQ